MIRKPYAIAAAITLIGISAAVAGSDLSPGSQALQSANESMHKAMAVEMTGDVDVDFMRGMIPHHQGAVDMAKIVLQYGKDPEVRKLAEQVVAAQETEIAFMNEWLAKNGAEAPPAAGASGDDTDHSAH